MSESGIAYVGGKTKTLDVSPEFSGYSKVVLEVTEDITYTAGNNTGRTLTLSCPWGTQKMANNILASIRGYAYQPYDATGAHLDPAAELGDGVTFNGLYSGIYAKTETFGSTITADVSAPQDEEIDHEFEYVSQTERTIKRNNKRTTAALKVNADAISAEVEARQSDTESLKASIKVTSDAVVSEAEERKSDVDSIHSTLEQHAGEISAKVSETGGDYRSFGWVLNPNSWTLSANGVQVMKVDKNGLYVDGTIRATSGSIGGFTIKENRLCTEEATFESPGAYGIYIGPDGISLGGNFSVDSAGNLKAYSGTFEGAVYAGNIQYGQDYFGNDYGTLDGGAITAQTITGGSYGEIAAETISYGNTAFTSTLDQVWDNQAEIASIKANYIESGALSTWNFKFGGHWCQWGYINNRMCIVAQGY